MIDLSTIQISQIAFLFFFFLSAFLVLHAVLNLIAHHSRLRLRMTELDAELAALRPRLPLVRQRIGELRRRLKPLKREQQLLSDYYQRLHWQWRELEARERAEAQAAGAAGNAQERPARNEIRRHGQEWEL